MRLNLYRRANLGMYESTGLKLRTSGGGGEGVESKAINSQAGWEIDKIIKIILRRGGFFVPHTVASLKGIFIFFGICSGILPTAWLSGAPPFSRRPRTLRLPAFLIIFFRGVPAHYGFRIFPAQTGFRERNWSV